VRGEHGAQATRQLTVAALLARDGQPPVPSGGRRRTAQAVEEQPSTSTPAEPPPPPETTPPETTPPETTPIAAGSTASVPASDRMRTRRAAVAALLVELVAAAAVGASLWLGFRWLWAQWPGAAVMLSVLLTVGVVVVARSARRAEDLSGTVLAVVVTLAVTASPALLTLAGG